MSTSQPLKWHGGKSYLAKWIIEHFPCRDEYTHYNEPFAGGLSVLFAHDPDGKSEAVNDLNILLSNFWNVLSVCNAFKEFKRIVQCIPLSEPEFCRSRGIDHGHSVYAAVDFFIRYRQSRQGLGKDYCTPTTRTRRGMNENVSAWLSAVDGLPEAHERLRRVEVRNMDAVRFIKLYDHEKALFYCDPPYLHDTRVTKSDYQHEMSEDDHLRLLDCLAGIKGKFILSGYPSLLYAKAADANGWLSVGKMIDNKASGKKSKEQKNEMLWMNYTPPVYRRLDDDCDD